MAYVLYTDGHREFPSDTEAEKLWRIKIGQANPQTAAQKRYVDHICKTVYQVRLTNYREAPEDYIRANIRDMVPFIVAKWIVDYRGRPTRPANKIDMEFAIKYGLWRGGKPTDLINTKKHKVSRQLTLL